MIKGLVSVLLTSYNKSSMVMEAIDSVHNQTYKDFELIILDDNSNEETRRVLDYFSLHIPESYAFKNPVRFYTSDCKQEDRMKEARYAVQANYGLTIANGEFISYCCDDDLYMPQRLEKMVELLNSKPEAQVVCGYQDTINLETGVRGERRYPAVINQAAYVVDHSSVMHRASLIEKVGNWPTHDLRAADATFWKKINDAGYPFYVVPEVLDIHRFNVNSISYKLDNNLPL